MRVPRERRKGSSVLPFCEKKKTRRSVKYQGRFGEFVNCGLQALLERLPLPRLEGGLWYPKCIRKQHWVLRSLYWCINNTWGYRERCNAGVTCVLRVHSTLARRLPVASSPRLRGVRSLKCAVPAGAEVNAIDIVITASRTVAVASGYWNSVERNCARTRYLINRARARCTYPEM